MSPQLLKLIQEFDNGEISEKCLSILLGWYALNYLETAPLANYPADSREGECGAFKLAVVRDLPMKLQLESEVLIQAEWFWFDRESTLRYFSL